MALDELLSGIPEQKQQAIMLEFEALNKQNLRLQSILIENMGAIELGISATDYFHTAKNYMAAIKGHADFLKRQMKGGTCDALLAFKTLETITRSIDLLSQLSKEALALKSEEYTPEEVDLNSVANRCAELSQGFSSTNAQIRIEYNGRATHKIYANPNQLEDAIHNLTINSSQAMPQGGKITISTEDIKIGQTTYVRITVADNGKGISKEDVENLFKQKKGLGLAKVKRVIELYNGVINVDSTTGKGSVFEIYFRAV